MPQITLDLDDDWYNLLEHTANAFKAPVDALALEIIMACLRASLAAMSGGEAAEAAEQFAGTELGKSILSRLYRLEEKHSGEAGIGT